MVGTLSKNQSGCELLSQPLETSAVFNKHCFRVFHLASAKSFGTYTALLRAVVRGSEYDSCILLSVNCGR